MDERSRHLKERRVEASVLKSDEEWQLLQCGAEEEASEGDRRGQWAVA
jgi:hypothetical protein